MNTFKSMALFGVLLTGQLMTAQVKVGDIPVTANTINSSAVFEVESTTKGLLPPRMTLAQLNAIATPAAGLIVFCIDCGTAGSGRLIVQGTTGGWAAVDGSTASALPGTPAAPVATNATATPNGSTPTISVAFAAPASNGSPITNYRVTSTPAAVVVTGTSSPIVVNTGLTLGAGYTFKVEAYNANGWSAASPASNVAVTGTVPAAPTSVVATTSVALVNKASVAFSVPNNGGSAITSYTVTSSPGGITATGTSSPIIVTGLTTATAYTFTIKATNSIGQSVASSASNSQTVYGTGVAGNAVCDQYNSTYYVTEVVEVVSTTGKTWMDRNLGASRAATSATDFHAYGCYFQWGRRNDGHANMLWTGAAAGGGVYSTSPAIATYNTQSPYFVVGNGSNHWYNGAYVGDGASTVLWNISYGNINNPCPTGFRVPSVGEFIAEFSAYGITNTATGFASPLKFPQSYQRQYTDSSLNFAVTGYYHTSSGGASGGPVFFSNPARIGTNSTLDNTVQNGLPVRCIKN